MVLYSKYSYGSQFSEEKNDLKIRYLVAKILSKNCGSFFSGHPVYFGVFFSSVVIMVWVKRSQLQFLGLRLEFDNI